jgi:hypothetical protein
MRVKDSTITEEIVKAENSKNHILCLCLLELKQFRAEKRFNDMAGLGVCVQEYFKNKIDMRSIS